MVALGLSGSGPMVDRSFRCCEIGGMLLTARADGRCCSRAGRTG